MHPIEHAGRFFTVRGPLNVPRPVQGQPVILHRDVPAGPMRLGAAASAEVVLAECATLAEAAASRRDWRALAQKQGRDPEGLRFIVRVMPILAESEQAARKRAAELDGLAGVDGHQASVPRVVGTPDQFADWLAQWHGAGACDGFDILPAVLPVDLDLLVEAVVPQLRRRGLRPAGYEQPTLRGHLGLRRAPSRSPPERGTARGAATNASRPVHLSGRTSHRGLAPWLGRSAQDPRLRLLSSVRQSWPNAASSTCSSSATCWRRARRTAASSPRAR